MCGKGNSLQTKLIYVTAAAIRSTPCHWRVCRDDGGRARAWSRANLALSGSSTYAR